MDTADATNDEQARLWNGASGRAWVDAQASLDRMFKPIETLLIDAVAGRSPRDLLDVGCGTGSTTIAAAQRLGPACACTGVDISEPMLAMARARAGREGLSVRFVCADAQTVALPRASVDAIMSRFGVMFFNDPVRAFTNLREAARPDAELRFVAWRSIDQNPFMTTAERAAAPLLPDLPPRSADGPGQFAFADDRRVHAILSDSGWTAIAIDPLDVACTLPESELVQYLTRFGPVGRVLGDADDTLRTRVIDTVRAAFERYVEGEVVRFTSACWMVTARSVAAAASGAS